MFRHSVMLGCFMWVTFYYVLTTEFHRVFARSFTEDYVGWMCTFVGWFIFGFCIFLVDFDVKLGCVGIAEKW